MKYNGEDNIPQNMIQKQISNEWAEISPEKKKHFNIGKEI
jgi:hypothetical protein